MDLISFVGVVIKGSHKLVGESQIDSLLVELFDQQGSSHGVTRVLIAPEYLNLKETEGTHLGCRCKSVETPTYTGYKVVESYLLTLSDNGLVIGPLLTPSVSRLSMEYISWLNQ